MLRRGLRLRRGRASLCVRGVVNSRVRRQDAPVRQGPTQQCALLVARRSFPRPRPAEHHPAFRVCNRTPETREGNARSPRHAERPRAMGGKHRASRPMRSGERHACLTSPCGRAADVGGQQRRKRRRSGARAEPARQCSGIKAQSGGSALRKKTGPEVWGQGPLARPFRRKWLPTHVVVVGATTTKVTVSPMMRKCSSECKPQAEKCGLR